MSKTHQEFSESGFLEDQREFFDKLITQDWETYESNTWDFQRKTEVIEIFRIVKNIKTVLDVGCGSGYHDLVFAQNPRVKNVVGIDYSAKSILQAEKHFPHSKIKRFVADIREPNSRLKRMGPFDLVTSFQVIEHLTDPLMFLACCANYVGPNGYIAVITPNYARLENRLRMLLGIKERKIDPMHFSEYSKSNLKNLGISLGLELIGSFGHTLSLKSKRFIVIDANSRHAVNIGRIFPNLANVIGLVFQKKTLEPISF